MFGIFVAPLIVAAVFTAVIASRRSRGIITAVSVLSVVVVGSLVTYWATWGTAFDELDAGREVSPGTSLIANLSTGTSAVAGVLLLVLGAVVLVTSMSRNNSNSVFSTR